MAIKNRVKSAPRSKRHAADKVASASKPTPSLPDDGRCRVALESASPEVEGGRFPAKGILGDVLHAEVDAFADGHDRVSGVVRFRHADEIEWHEAPLRAIGNDRWRGDVSLTKMGSYWLTFAAWIDHWGTWRSDMQQRVAAEQDVSVDLRIGAGHIREAAERAQDAKSASKKDINLLNTSAKQLEAGGNKAIATAMDSELDQIMHRYADRSREATYSRELEVVVDRERARFSAWYERFPRSTASKPSEHGTFSDLQQELPRIASMGFDVLYLPPIHPIGRSHRKGPNNSVVAGPEDPGSPWAIGAEEGGHTAIHPDLGTLDDFDRLLAACSDHGLELALDLAYQCAPDHPWVQEHPEWFRHRPDGSIQYAENPPKKYQDIYPIDFETDDWQALWHGLKEVVDYWVDRGVRIFRVDNPHTKAFPFWEWMIGAVRAEHPDVIFLAEAFTRPKVMKRLAKVGFQQSYTYFAWRQSAHEMREYLEELIHTDVADYFRPNFWPNTPDILTEQLQQGGRGTYVARLVLAATLSASYGIYGPAFELMESTAVKPGSEEYLDSEKYQVRWRDLDATDSLTEVITRVNAARQAHPALRRNDTLHFHHVDDPALLAYSKSSPDGDDVMLMIVNLDDNWRHGSTVRLDLGALGISADEPWDVHDLLGGATYHWHGADNYVELDPEVLPAHMLHVRRSQTVEEGSQ